MILWKTRGTCGLLPGAQREEKYELCACGEAETLPLAGKIAADNRGVGVVEIILIMVVLIALVIIFKSKMTSLVNTIFNTITKNTNSVLK